MYNKYMLFAGWEVRMVKNCDLGLENTARGRTAYGLGHSFFVIYRLRVGPYGEKL